jgi:beta-glucosidase/6-phospho-beta-glucosidase/beta-galactosidase
MLEKELRRLQRELNSPRLNRYIQGDDSEEQKERFREREVKLARFNEILDLLRKMDKYADGGDILDQDTISRIDNADLADASAYKYGGEIRSKEEIKKLYKDKVNYVKTLNPEQVVKSWNRNSWGVVHGYQEPIKYGEYKPELRMYLANLLFELELTEEEYKAYLKSGGYVRKTPATFKDKVA